MKSTKTLLSIIVSAAVLALAGCASTPQDQQNAPSKSDKQENASMTKEHILSHPDVKGHPPVVFAKNLEEVRQAGLRSLTFVGCKLKTCLGSA